MGFANHELSKVGSKNHAELFALLSYAKHLYLSALRGTIAPSADIDGPDVAAGATIFDAILTALSHYHFQGDWEVGLPNLGEQLFNGVTDAAILPPPIFAAMTYLLDQVRSVSLAQLNVSTGSRVFDYTYLAWPRTILQGHQAQRRFYYEILDSYSGTPLVQPPILSDSRTRAVQLLAVGEFLIERELKRIGEPPIAQIFLPYADTSFLPN